MGKTVLLPILLSFVLLPHSILALTEDFCVADLIRSDTPAGYPCKPVALVTAEDFYYHGLATPGPYIEPFGIAFVTAFDKDYPGLNGMGISALRLDIAVGGVVPLNTIPRGNEIFFVIKGMLNVGFVSSSSNTVYTKTLDEGDLFAFPQGLVRFAYNVGNTTAVALAVYGNQNPGIQITDYALFANNLPSSVVEKVTFLDDPEVKKLKALFGPRAA